MQVGIISSRLFDVYINNLYFKIYNSNIGGSVGNTVINHLCCGDDV